MNIESYDFFSASAAQPALERKVHLHSAWAENIDPKQWAIYDAVIRGAQDRGIPFALGGAFAVASYIGGWRNSKDIDLYILPKYRKRMVALLSDLGLADYYEKLPYDRKWIYRSTTDGVIIDVMWAMANRRARVDEWWMSGPEVQMREHKLQVLPPEVLLWDKLYVLQRERCDWPDVLNILYFCNANLDWKQLLDRMGDDTDLLAGALSIFRWMSPGCAQKLPDWLWAVVKVEPPPPGLQTKADRRRVSFLDRRPWYGPDRRKQLPS